MAGRKDAPTTRSGRCILVVADDTAFAMMIGTALEAAGLCPRVIAGIDERFVEMVTEECPAVVVVDLLMPTADALRLGRWIARVCPGPVQVAVVVPGTTSPGLPEVTTDRLRVLRRPIAPELLARSLELLVRPTSPADS